MGKKKSKNSTTTTSSSGNNTFVRSSSAAATKCSTRGTKAAGDGATDSGSTTLPDDLMDNTTTADEIGTNGGGGDQQQQDPVELLQVDTGDMVKVKQVLDEGVAAALLEYLPENTQWDNTKLLLMVVACVFAITAQFAPIPFPESRLLLGACGAAYFIVSGILQAIQTFIDKDAILWTRPLDEEVWSGRTSTNNSSNNNTTKKFSNPDLKQYGLLVRSSFPRFSEFFTVIIQFHMKAKSSKEVPPPPPPAVSKTWSVGQFFDKEGYFDEVGLGLEVDKLFEKFDQKQYDSPTIAVASKSSAKPKKE